MHQPIPEQGKWLWHVVRGYFNYHAVPTNARALDAFRHHVTDLWRRTLRRRSQKDRITWARMTQAGGRLASETDHPSSLAERSLCRHTPEVGAVCGKAARTVLCGGRAMKRASLPLLSGASSSRCSAARRRRGRSRRARSRPSGCGASACS